MRDGWIQTRRSGSHRVLVMGADEEAGNWHYRVPALHINGGGTPTRADAEQECLSATAFAPEGNPDYDQAAETVTLDVRVAPAA